MHDIVLSTLNARYAHASFGLRYLMANLPEALASRAMILEFDINQRAIDIVEKILLQRPKIVGLGIYIWNVEQSLQVISQIKRLRPDLIIVVGGPEASYETDQQEICRLADYVICGEADLAFGKLCESLLTGRRPLMRVIQAELPEFESLRASVPSCLRASLALPYSLYTDHDLQHRVIYVEASRGCPFKCEFCLSSLDVPVRNVPLEPFLAEMQKLLDRGLTQFKFVDRTFNLNVNFSKAILQFFLDRYFEGLFLHFEMIPDRLPEALRELIAKFPPGALQFEVGIQTFNPEVEKLISRRQDHTRLDDNLRWLREGTGVHVHTDLIVGLPGEDIESFGRGFDKLVSLRPQEIQVGILKRLRGTPIVRHDKEWEMVYSPHAPYEVLQTKLVDFPMMQRMKRFARYWDLIANSGNFVATTAVLLSSRSPLAGEGRGEGETLGNSGREDEARDGHDEGVALSTTATPHPNPLPQGERGPATHSPLAGEGETFGNSGRENEARDGHGESAAVSSSAAPLPSPLPQGERGPFARFLALADWLYTTTGQTHAISLTNLAELIFRFCTQVQHQPAKLIAEAIWLDFQRVGRSDRPDFLKPYVGPADTREIKRQKAAVPSRQAKHLRTKD